MPSTADNFGRFPYEVVTSTGLISSSSQLKAFETGGQGLRHPAHVHAAAPVPGPRRRLAHHGGVPGHAAVPGNPLAGTTTPLLVAADLVSNLRSQYNNPHAVAGVPGDAQVVVYVFVTPDSARAAVSTLDHTLYPGVPAAVLLVAAVAYLATRRALRPVEAIRTRTAAVTAADPRERVRVPDTGDEIARLAITINNTLQRLDDAAQAQRRFVADAAHELRSPISSLLTTVEVAEAYPDRADWPETIATTAEQARRIQDLAEDLLLLARMDATVPANSPARTVDLAALARDTAAAPGARPATHPDDRHVSVTCTRTTRCSCTATAAGSNASCAT
jgi:signal transduction histidine kinase